MGFNVVTANDSVERRSSIIGLKDEGYEITVIHKRRSGGNESILKSLKELKNKYSGITNKPKQVVFIPEDQDLVTLLNSEGIMAIKYYPKYN